MYPVSVTTFIKDNFRGGFCLFESMATMLAMPIQEFVVLDCGSTDGTLEVVQEIERSNDRVHVLKHSWPLVCNLCRRTINPHLPNRVWQDPNWSGYESGFWEDYRDPNWRLEDGRWRHRCAGLPGLDFRGVGERDAFSFAVVANQCMSACACDNVFFYQADEVWHPALLPRIEREWSQENYSLRFWRIQLENNFQRVRWLPHLVHRGVVRDRHWYVGDGMNTNDTSDSILVSDWQQAPTIWGDRFGDDHDSLPWAEFVFDVHSSFDLNMVDWRKLHAEFWSEDENVVDGMSVEDWDEKVRSDPNIGLEETRFGIPKILKGCVGMGRYRLREELLAALKEDNTGPLVFENGSG